MRGEIHGDYQSYPFIAHYCENAASEQLNVGAALRSPLLFSLIAKLRAVWHIFVRFAAGVFHVTKICHFLLIEDDRDEAFLLERAFSKIPNCSFALCRNLSEAKAYLRGAGVYASRKLYPLPQVILSDLNIGPDSGIELLGWCRKEDEFRATPLIIFTGSAHPAEIQNAFREGAQDVIQKPFNNEALIQTLRSLAEKFCA